MKTSQIGTLLRLLTIQSRQGDLPGKLVDAFGKDSSKSRYVKEKAVAAARLHFLDSGPSERAKLFERLDSFLSSKKK